MDQFTRGIVVHERQHRKDIPTVKTFQISILVKVFYEKAFFSKLRRSKG